VQDHANDLRVKVARAWSTLVESPESPTPDDAVLDAFVHQAVDDWRLCDLSAPVVRLLEYAEQVTRTPADVAESDVAGLRNAGWSDTAIHDAVQVIAYFNYINRVAEGLGVELEEGLPHWGKR
jgi:alkylhydroperoxidase family enzyme